MGKVQFLFFISTDNIFISGGGLTRNAVRIYQFITNNHVSLHLWRQQNFLKYQKVSKYYKHDCWLAFDNEIGKCMLSSVEKKRSS